MYEWEVTGSHSTRTKKKQSLAVELALNTTVTSLLTQPAVALAMNLRRRFVTAQEKIRLGSKLTCGGQEKLNEQDSGVEVVRECLTEEGNSTLGVFFREPLRAKLQDK